MTTIKALFAAAAAIAIQQSAGIAMSHAANVVVATPPRVVVAPRPTVAPRLAVPRVAPPRVAARPAATTRVKLNNRAAVRAGKPRTVIVTSSVTPGGGCSGLRSRAGAPGSSNHRYWMARYNRCLAQ